MRHVLVSTGTASGKTLAFNLPVLSALAADPKLRALRLPDEGARTGPGPRARGLRLRRLRAAYLRRRHTAGAAMAGPEVGERDPHEPRHAPHGRAATPRTVGRRAREPAVRRHRRGSRLPRRVRLPRRKRPQAPPPSPRRCLRREPAVRADVGDDQESGPARREPDRRAGVRDR